MTLHIAITRPAEFIPLKMEAIGFGKGPNMGLQAHHNFIADPEIP